MAQTIQDIVRSARELAFDRFITPTFVLTGKSSSQKLEISEIGFRIYSYSGVAPSPIVETLDLQLYFVNYPTMDSLVAKLRFEGYDVTYSGGFVGNGQTFGLTYIPKTAIATPLTIYRQNFFADLDVLEIVRRYFVMLLGYNYDTAYNIALNTPLADVNITNAQPHHMALWSAFWIVDTRRIYELAAETMGLTTSDYTNMSGSGMGGLGVNVNLGDVFSVTESPRERFNDGEKSWGVGADNVLGDASGFWYRLQLWIRSQFERLFSDFALRADNVVIGTLDLEKDTNFYAYYDQYPYTISPLSREILSSFSP